MNNNYATSSTLFAYLMYANFKNKCDFDVHDLK